MGQEYDCDKPPYTVQAGVFTQRWYLIQAERERPQTGLYVGLIAVQAELGSKHQPGSGGSVLCQAG